MLTNYRIAFLVSMPIAVLLSKKDDIRITNKANVELIIRTTVEDLPVIKTMPRLNETAVKCRID